MKYIFVGDIHGKFEMVEKALAMDGKKIFVGDLIDSFDKSLAAHKKCFELVLDAIEKGDAECLFGNHELSYLRPVPHRCSGWDAGRAALMSEYSERIWKNFTPFLLLAKDFLVTHAGLTKQIWEKKHLNLDRLPNYLRKSWEKPGGAIHQIGYARGGNKDCGGIFWCDFRHEFQPIEGLTQVFGHTRGHGIRQKGTSFCIDCLDLAPEFLIMEI